MLDITMSGQQPTVVAAGPGQRRFAASAVALQAIVINSAEQVLLLSSPMRKQGWQLVSGALEAGETLLDGTLREVAEELGTDVRVRPLGTVHVETFHYDERVRYMIGVYTLFAYQSGDVQPGDDMAGSAFRWWALDELDDKQVVLHVTAKRWMLRRAIVLYRLWVNQPEWPLQPAL
jgi:8-oxo-dGTP pyrophosphatase MutT (NUDIX family)